MKKPVLGALMLSSLFAAPLARAQSLGEQINGTNFGNPGQVAVAGDFTLSFRHANDSSHLLIAPAADYFFLPHLSFGGQVLFAYDSYKGGGHATTFGLGPRIGYDIPLAAMFTFYPRLTLSYELYSPSGPADSSNLLGMTLYAPFLFHPVPHFFVGFGPSFGGNFAGGNDGDHYFIFELVSTVGGYFDW
jgi:hypothetical protein